jgi:hypothetical protein
VEIFLEKRRVNMLMRGTPLTAEERNERSIIALTEKIDQLREVVLKQSEIINQLRKDVKKKTKGSFDEFDSSSNDSNDSFGDSDNGRKGK